MDAASEKTLPQPMSLGEDVIAAHQAGTLWGLFCERVRRSPDAVAYRDYDLVVKEWRDHGWRSIAQRVDRFRAALARTNLEPGDRLAVLLPNGIDWVCLDLAAHAAGLVVVGLYPHDTAASNAYILGHSDARLILLDTHARWQSLLPFRSEFPSLEHVWVREHDGSPLVSSGLTLLRLADAVAAAREAPTPFPAAPTDVATLIYTSGTTGRPKGVKLTHFALLWNAQASAVIVPPRRDDVFLSILPVAHVFERTVGYYLPMMGGCTVAYARSVQDLAEDLIAVRPSAMLGVPELYARMASAIRSRVATNIVKRSLLRIAAVIGWNRFEATQLRAKSSPIARLVWPILGRYVAKPVMAAFGGRLRVAISGGAPLDQDVSRLLIGLGLPLVEGYGLTETAPVVAANGLDNNLPGSVGFPLQGVEVRLAAAGELLVRSPSMMTGYWKDDAGTTRALDPAGWLSTGDIAEIRNGRLFICGRVKETIVLSIGEKVNPNVVEAELARDSLVAQAMVVGDHRPFLAAVIVLNAEVWRRFAAEKGLDPDRPNHEGSKIEVLARLTPWLATLPRYAQVRAIHLTLEPWTVSSGVLTPTLKIKRDTLQALFAEEINGLYAKSSTVTAWSR